jgi:hypothetical protein
MIKNINDLIELNLNLICKNVKRRFSIYDLKDVNNKEMDSVERKQLSNIMESKGLIVIEGEMCLIDEPGLKVFNDGGWLKCLYSKKQQDIEQSNSLKEKDDLELRKTKADVELTELTLKEFPRTKWFARIGFIIAIVLLLKELYVLIWQ